MGKRKTVPPEAIIIGRNLRNLRERTGVTQQKLAPVLEVTFQQLQKYESGRNRLPVEKLHRLKKFFRVPYDLFFEGLAGEETEVLSFQMPADAQLRSKIERVVAIMLE